MNAPTIKKTTFKDVWIPPVIVGALGYFVDVYDLVLFGIVRVASLRDIGIAEDQLMNVGVDLINIQMIGMLIGGILWGVIGDKKGRISVLFGSILMYSLANLLNAFVTNVPQYMVLRLIAGIGLAGELGAAITLVSESLPKESRGYGTTLVAGIGMGGALLSGFCAEMFSWKAAYIIGGVLGLGLLVTRLKMHESGIFNAAHDDAKVSKGNFFMFFQQKERFLKYIQCITVGIPVWLVVGLLLPFAPELGKTLNLSGPVTSSYAIMIGYFGLFIGDLIAGLLSQQMRSRKKVLGLCLASVHVFAIIYCYLYNASPIVFYGVCFMLGVSAGYWALFVSMSSELFGTNIRATATTTIPNFVRASIIAISLSFKELSNHMDKLTALMIVGTVVMFIAYLALYLLPETFAKDLNFIERD